MTDMMVAPAESLLARLHREHRERRARLFPAKPSNPEPPRRPVVKREPVRPPQPYGTPIPVVTKPVFLALRDSVKKDGRPSLRLIQKVVARAYGVSVKDILSSRRTGGVVRPRQVAMHLARTMTLRSLPEIGRAFGGRDHTTVWHALQRMERFIAGDPDFFQHVDALRAEIAEESADAMTFTLAYSDTNPSEHPV